MNKIINGIDHFDTENNLIQCHGSKIYYFKNNYYWIGENKELTDGINGIWHNGVNCYKSKDLVNFEYQGIIIEANDDINSTLNRKSKMDRPHLLYNEKYDYYVIWLKIMNEDGSQDMTILKAKNILGPYEIVKEHYHPFPFSTGDFDLFIENNKAYWIYEMVHNGLAISELDERYLDAIDYAILENDTLPPFTREAPVYFKYNNRHFLVTSGTTSYFANPSMIYELKTIKGPIIKKYYSHINDLNNNSFNSQISGVINCNGKLIFIADIWYPNNKIKYSIVEKIFKDYARGNVLEATNTLKTVKDLVPIDSTKDSKYLFFDLTIKNNNPYFEYKNEIKLDK